MNQPALFQFQYLAPNAEGVYTPAAGFELYTWLTGTTTDHPTYQDQAGAVPNTNPVILDADGFCDLWLDPAVEYTLQLRYPPAQGGAVVWTRNNVAGAAGTTSTVTSVNEQTGDVSLTADLIPFESSAGLGWFSVDNVEAALDVLAERSNEPAASTVTVVDAGAYFTGANVETVLQELGARKLPDPAGHSGEFLTTDGAAFSWAPVRSSYRLVALGATSATRTVKLQAGTYEMSLESHSFKVPEGLYNVTQVAKAVTGATTVSVNTTQVYDRDATAPAYLIHAYAINKVTLLVGTTAEYVLTIEAMVVGDANGNGAILTIERMD